MNEKKAVEMINKYLDEDCTNAEWVECLGVCKNVLNRLIQKNPEAKYVDTDQIRHAVCNACPSDLIDTPNYNDIMSAIIEAIQAIPIADVRKVARGEWVPKQFEDQFRSYTNYFCSVCGRRLIGYSNPKDAPYCHCGADMRGD